MRRVIKFFSLSAVCCMIFFTYPITALAWGDNSEDGKGRPSYTTEDLEYGEKTENHGK